ncbi:DUF4145 domain-containing protein [Verminephrobacter aporrectodeae]|nr:DUF4145 domain-containing protein [Verminephrobacter aporrectodeae]
MSTASKPQTIWSHCNGCGQETKHEIVHKASRRRSFDDDQYSSVEVGSEWTIVQCCGCEEVSMRRVDWCSEDDYQGDLNPPTFFPARVSRRKPVWLTREHAPSTYVGMLDEVYATLHADSRRLAMMGARAIIDVVITRTVGDQGSFSKGLDELKNKDLISKRDRDIIEAAVNAGSAAMHRGHQPTADDVNVVIDIVERMVHAEILEAKAKELAATTPP